MEESPKIDLTLSDQLDTLIREKKAVEASLVFPPDAELIIEHAKMKAADIIRLLVKTEPMPFEVAIDFLIKHASLIGEDSVESWSRDIVNKLHHLNPLPENIVELLEKLRPFINMSDEVVRALGNILHRNKGTQAQVRILLDTFGGEMDAATVDLWKQTLARAEKRNQ